jgi:hypothetical protein
MTSKASRGTTVNGAPITDRLRRGSHSAQAQPHFPNRPNVDCKGYPVERVGHPALEGEHPVEVDVTSWRRRREGVRLGWQIPNFPSTAKRVHGWIVKVEPVFQRGGASGSVRLPGDPRSPSD